MKHTTSTGKGFSWLRKTVATVIVSTIFLSSTGMATVLAVETSVPNETTIENVETPTITEASSVTVTLPSAANGKLTFTDNVDLDSVSVSASSLVSITVVPSEYYELSAIVAVDTAGAVLKGDYSEGVFTFRAGNTDVTVYAEFASTFSNDVAEEVDGTADEVVTTDNYILSNLNASYVNPANATTLTSADVLAVKYIAVDASKVPSDLTVSEFWYEDYYNSVLDFKDFSVDIFDVDPESEYYVAYANTLLNDEYASVSNWEIAYNSTDGVLLPDCFYDETTGLMYIPKHYTEENRNGTGVLNVVVEFMVLVNLQSKNIEDGIQSEVKLQVNLGDDVDGTFVDDTVVVADSFNDGMAVQLTEDPEALATVSEDDLSVRINSVDAEQGADYMYDAETGVLYLNADPMITDSVEVSVDTESPASAVVQTMLSTFSNDVYAGTWTEWMAADFTLAHNVVLGNESMPVVMRVDGTPTVGDVFDFTGANVGSFMDAYANGGNPYTKLVTYYSWLTDSTVPRSVESIWTAGSQNNPSTAGNPAYRLVYLSRDPAHMGGGTGDTDWAYEASRVSSLMFFIFGSGVDIPSTGSAGAGNFDGKYVWVGGTAIRLGCFHASAEVDESLIGGSETPEGQRVRMRIVAFHGTPVDYEGRQMQIASVAVAGPANVVGGGQSSGGMFRMYLEIDNGQPISVHKISDVTIPAEWTAGNPYYGSLSSAVFTLSGNGITPVAAQVGTDGNANFGAQSTGTYLISETTTPMNYMTSADTSVTLSTAPVSVTITNTPITGSMRIQKTCRPEDRVIVDNNPNYTYAGAVFVLTANWNSNLTFTQTTDATGLATFPVLPLGTYTLTETVAPAGFKIAPPQTVVIGSSATVDLTVADAAFDDPVRIALNKLSHDGQPWTQGNANLDGAIFSFQFYSSLDVTRQNVGSYTPLFSFNAQTVYSLSTNEYVVNLEQGAGSVIPSSWSYVGSPSHTLNEFYDVNGEFRFPEGTIVIKEISSPDGYLPVNQDSGWYYRMEIDNGVVYTYDSDGNVVGATSSISAIESSDNFILIKIPAVSGATQQNADIDVFNTITLQETETIRGGFSITKFDSQNSTHHGQGDAEMGPVTFSLVNRSVNTVVVGGVQYIPNSVIAQLTLTMDAAGNIQTYTSASDYLPYGSYELIETLVSADYAVGHVVGGVTSDYTYLFNITTDGVIVDGTAYGDAFVDAVYRGGISLQKYDAQTLLTTPQGNASFAGAQFEIVNQSVYPIYLNNGTQIGVGQVAMTITTNEAGVASTGNYVLPIGTYSVRETVAPTGYIINGSYSKQSFVIASNGQMINATWIPTSVGQTPPTGSMQGCAESVIRGGVTLYKSDADRISTASPIGSFTNAMNVGQGDASLAGYRFYIVNNSTRNVVVGGVSYVPGAIVYTLVTNANGMATTDTNLDGFDTTLPYGTYGISEAPQGQQTSSGYTVDSTFLATFSITTNGTVVQANTYAGNSVDQAVWRGGAAFVKVDMDRNTNVAQADATLSGAEISIINRSALSVYVNGAWYAPGQVCLRILTNAQGQATTTATALPYGTYEAVETAASVGYLLNSDWSVTFSIRVNGTIYRHDQTPLAEAVIRGDVQITKNDVELSASEALGGEDHGATGNGTNLNDIQFEIYNASTLDIYVDPNGYGNNRQTTQVNGVWYAVDDLVMTISTHWNAVTNTYTAETVNRTLPYGTYLIREIPSTTVNGIPMANESYILTDGAFRTFEIRTDGELVTVDTSANALTWENQVVRGDCMFNKQDFVTQARLWTAWVLENVATGERHVVVTDQNGQFYSSVAGGYSHETNTNGNDALLTQFDANVRISMADTNYAAGVWFGLGEDGTVATPDDALGALPYGEYILTEIPSDTNADYTDLITTHFWVERQGREVNLGTITNGNEIIIPPTVSTTATHNETGLHMGPALEATLLVDLVEYTNLIPGHTYRLDGALMVRETGLPVMVDDGTGVMIPVVVSMPILCETEDERNGSLEMDFLFDARAYEGQSVVVFERLFDTTFDPLGTLVARHANINDAGQTVMFPAISTSVIVSATGEREALAEGTIVFVDTVTYSGLTPNRLYTLVGTFFDLDDNDEVQDANGNDLTVTRTFTPTTESGTIDMTFTMDASTLAGHTIVAFEELRYQGNVIALHADLADVNQTITFPEIGTTATFASGIDMGMKEERTQINDTVAYSNLTVGNIYTLSGILMNPADGTAVLDSTTDAPVTRQITFTAIATDGTVVMPFEFDSREYAGNSVVVFESLYINDNLIAHHDVLTDAAQTFGFPEIGTNVLYQGLHEAPASMVSLTDAVMYQGLNTGVEYTVNGTLMYRDSNSPVLDTDGNPIVASTVFTPDAVAGTVDVVFALDATALAGRDIVVFERLSTAGIQIAIHEDITDANQTISFPRVQTRLVSSPSGLHLVEKDSVVNLVDTVYYENLTVGTTYTFTGHLVNQATGNTIGEPVSVSLVSTAPDGQVDIAFTLDTTGLSGQTVVAFESVYAGDVLVASHEDINDENQSVTVVGIGTTATIDASETVMITDLIAYEGLTVGDSYVLTGLLMNKSTGQPYQNPNGTAVTSTVAFVAETASGTVEVTFDCRLINIDTAVVFETLFFNGTQIASHRDINDESQTVRNPKISTVATTGVAGEERVRMTIASEDTQLIDTVSYSGFIPGTTYVMTGTIYDVTADRLTDLVAETTFTPELISGTVDVTFNFDSTAYEGHILVVFETAVIRVGEDTTIIVRHEDINDENQTIYIPIISTELLDSLTGLHTASVGESVMLTDFVSYENVVPGQTYILTGTLMDKATGEEFTDANGVAITSSVEFVPTNVSGIVEIDFTFSNVDVAGKNLVAFERLIHNGKDIAVHADINDDAQTISFPTIRTLATDATTGTQQIVNQPEGNVKIIDTVSYTGLITGTTYDITGTLMNRATGEELTHDDGTIYESVVTFVAPASAGEIEVPFEVPVELVAGKTIVIFEVLSTTITTIPELSDGVVIVARDEDIDNVNQTVYSASLDTVAFANDRLSKTVPLSTETKLIDTIAYMNLSLGQTYKVVGHVLDKNTNAFIAESTALFTPTAMTGAVDMTFTVDTSKMVAGTVLVCYEAIYDPAGHRIASHWDANDLDQSVTVRAITIVQTGVQNYAATVMIIAVSIMALAVFIISAVLGYRKMRIRSVKRKFRF